MSDQPSKVFGSYGAACAHAKSIALAQGSSVSVIRTSLGWTVADFSRHEPLHAHQRPSSGPELKTPSWYREESETPEQKQARSQEMQSRYEDLQDQQVRAELNRQKAHAEQEICEACGRPIHACRCAL